MPSLRKAVLAALVFMVSVITPALAMTVSPMHVEMTSAGAKSHARVSVINNSNKPLPIEAVVGRLTLDEAGKSKIAKAGEDFLVMPPQAMIPPGATQNFRIQWLGDPLMQKSESFILQLNQIPVKMAPGQSGVQVVMSMGVMVNVAPINGSPALNLVSTTLSQAKSGKRVLSVLVQNPSTTHALLSQSTLRLQSGGWSQVLSPGELGDRVGIGLVQPGQRRKFTFPIDIPSGVDKVAARIEFPSRR